MKNNRTSILIIISVQLIFLSACVNKALEQKSDSSEAPSMSVPTNSFTDRGGAADKENVPDWCKTPDPNEVEQQNIDWSISGSEGVVKQLFTYANSSNEVGTRIHRFTSLSPNAKWYYTTGYDNYPAAVINISDKVGKEIQIPINDQINVFNTYAEWSPDSNALLIEGKRHIDPYLSSGIVIVQMNSGGELISNLYVLPNNLETQIYSYWSPDSKQFLLAYQEDLSLRDTQPPKFAIVNLNGTVYKEIQLPEGKYLPYVIWATDGIYFVRYSRITQIYEVDRIDLEFETPQIKFSQVYSSRYPIALYGVNAKENEILIREGESKTSTCLSSWNVITKTRQYSFRFPDTPVKIYNGEEFIGLGFYQYDKANNYYEYFYVFDWHRGFIKVNDSFNFPLGWNSIIKGFLFTNDEFPNIKIGALVPSPK